MAWRRRKGIFTNHQSINYLLKSRSEQAPGSVFHPRDENTQIYCEFFGHFWCNKKIKKNIIKYISYASWIDSEIRSNSELLNNTPSSY